MPKLSNARFQAARMSLGLRFTISCMTSTPSGSQGPFLPANCVRDAAGEPATLRLSRTLLRVSIKIERIWSTHLLSLRSSADQSGVAVGGSVVA